MRKLILAFVVVGAVLLLLPVAGRVLAAPGDGPVNATTLDCGVPVTVPPGSYWLKITNTPGWQVTLTLAQPPGGGLSFAVYTADQAAKYGADQPMIPTGSGTPLGGVAGADLNWEGHLPQGGVFYILVKNMSQFPVTLNFTSCARGGLQYEMLPPPPPSGGSSLRQFQPVC